ncbi:N-acetylmuramic acid 6-phosphate etherase [Kocuria massiliensis]|uniref:N-acetylmuramic acid 6-phosphate etherase n=1 Tax=Kocuria massiliensis TaxID=1926282 RepID=UPI000A1CAE87|nr:N-acetylmuramic acid 6-phosphate etherase [Kocuria massiliensis]
MSQSSPLTTTESVNAEFADLDRMSTEELARTMNRQDAVVPEAVAQRTTEIANLVEAALPGLRAGGRLIYAGAGTAGRLGVLDASECPPTFNTRPGQVVGLIAGGSEALVSAIEGAEDDAALDVGPEDTVVGVSASGRTPYAIGAVREAARRQATTASIACNEGSELAAAAQHPIDVVVGPELVAGSTRLKSGTAQKLVLNMISTIAMVRLGKTYGNLMVDVQSTNVKLRERVRRIVADVTGAGPQEVEDAVEGADGSAKVAILSILGGMTADQARTELDHHAGVLRAALERTGNHY